MKFLSKTDFKKSGETALLRLDFNTEDDWRMRAVLPTIKFLLRGAKKIVIISHRGRPPRALIRSNGRMAGFDGKFSLKRDAAQLGRLLNRKVRFLPLFDFAGIRRQVAAAPRGSVFVLENVRFWKGEEKDDAAFARKLASLADFYVNDAFAVCHRANASVSAITRFLPSYAGLELEKEIGFLSRVLKKPRKPLVLVLGGGKAADKLGVIRYFGKKADGFLLGGAAANTILSLRGFDVKKSLVDKDKHNLEKLRKVLGYENIFLPRDFKFVRGAILDIGPRTAGEYRERLARARTIIWSGPLGLIEKKVYAGGTLAIATGIAGNHRAFSVAGGGETVMFLKKFGLDKKFSFISTGGGAMLDFLAGKKLPGIEALRYDQNFNSLIRANQRTAGYKCL